MILHASCGDPSSRRSHPISIPIPVISSLCLILRPSLRPFICTSVPPSVRLFVCLQLQSIQIQKTGKFLFTLSHDDAPHPHHNHLHHLFQNCPSVHIPQLSRKYFLSHFKSAPFQKRAASDVFKSFANLSLVSFNTDSPTLHTPVQSEAPPPLLPPPLPSNPDTQSV